MSFDCEYGKQIVQTYLNQKNWGDTKWIANTVIIKENYDIDDLGMCICALANYAACEEIPYAYAIWGVDESKRTVIGSHYRLPTLPQLSAELSIRAVYSIMEITFDEKPVVILEVQSASNTTMQYKGIEYILNDNLSLAQLTDLPEKEKQLWKKLNTTESYEIQTAKSNASIEEIVKLLDCEKLFSMLCIPYPKNPTEIIAKLTELRFVIEKNTGKYTVTNLGALLLAKRLKWFPTVAYKAVRVLKYNGTDVTGAAKEQLGGKGYIVGFEGLIKYIEQCLPTVETFEGAIRKNTCIYPLLSIRELVANALIHQDLNERGAPVVSIFSDRIEITNPGKPLIRFDRFIDHPPLSRNEALASAMHKVGICEERGSGYDKVVSYVEKYNLPAPIITAYERSTKVSIFSRKDFDAMSKKEKIAACYAHVCLNYVKNKSTNNTTLRERFQLSIKERYKVSRVFSDACNEKLIKPQNGTGMKNREYIPYWAPDNEI